MPRRRRATDTLLADHYRRMLTFDFGRSDADDAPIARRGCAKGAGPSLALTVPLFVLGLVLAIGDARCSWPSSARPTSTAPCSCSCVLA